MADLCCAYTIAGIVINNPTAGADRLVLGEDGISGLDGAPIRAEIDDQGQSDGGIVHPKFYAARVIVFRGFCHIQSVTVERSTAYYTALNNLEALFCHDRQLRSRDRLFEGQLAGDHLFDVAAESVLVALRENDRTADLLGVFPVRSHVRKFLAFRFDPAKVLVNPHDDVALLRRLRQFVEAVERVHQCLAAGNDRVHDHSAAMLAQVFECTVLQQVVPQWKEG